LRLSGWLTRHGSAQPTGGPRRIKVERRHCSNCCSDLLEKSRASAGVVVLRSGDQDPDFEPINAPYFLGREKWEPKRESLTDKLLIKWRSRVL